MATDATVNESHGISMGFHRFFGDVGFVFGPVVLGLVADASGLAAPFYVMAGIMPFNATLIFIFAKETLVRKKPGEEASP
jgi:sugar phosphate permease